MVHRVWLGLFLIWMILLTGFFVNFTGTPGFFQLWKLRGMLAQKKLELEALDQKTAELESQRKRLESDPLLQEQEIRRVLGYVAPNEMVFDFSKSQSRP